jgi:HEAT repeat protein
VTNGVIITPEERKYVTTLVDKLSGDYQSKRREAARELRALTRKQPSYRAYIGEAQIIPILIPLLLSSDSETQEHVVTTLLNLSIHEPNKSLIAEKGGIPPVVEVLRSGNMAARENAAAALFSLSALEENKARIGACDAIPPLVELLRDGNARGKKDAASALFNLCIYPPGNRSKSVRAGLVPLLL